MALSDIGHVRSPVPVAPNNTAGQKSTKMSAFKTDSANNFAIASITTYC